MTFIPISMTDFISCYNSYKIDYHYLFNIFFIQFITMSFNGYVLPMVWQKEFKTPPQKEWIVPEEFDIEAQYEFIPLHTVSFINLFIHWLDPF
jgi:hypothetical protein